MLFLYTHFTNSVFICFFIALLFDNTMTFAQSTSIRYLALGDSYTIGEGVTEQERWPVILAKRLEIAMPAIIAKTGWTTDELLAAIKKESHDKNYGLVSLLIGVNNQYRGYDLDIYRKEFAQLLQQAISFAGDDPTKVFVVSIPDYGVTPFAAEKQPQKISEEINIYNSINKEISLKMRVRYFDITPISRNAAQYQTLLAEDQLHPSGKMYRMWVESFVKEVVGMLGQ
jgi:acyl-CoA thioesterase I